MMMYGISNTITVKFGYIKIIRCSYFTKHIRFTYIHVIPPLSLPHTPHDHSIIPSNTFLT